MDLLSLTAGFLLTAAAGFIAYLSFLRLTHSVEEQTETFVFEFGKLTKVLNVPGLYLLPKKLFPWVQVISVSKRLDSRLYKGIQVNDRFGTTVIIDLWIEFRITDAYRALFSTENWDEVLKGVVLHSASSILSAQTVDEILSHRSELAGKLQAGISMEIARWGLSLEDAMIQNIGLLPEVSKRFFQAVAARIERTTALIEEEGRLKCAKHDAETELQIAEFNGLARSQTMTALSQFYGDLAKEPVLMIRFKEYWELSNLDPRKTVTFSGFKSAPLDGPEAVRALESVVSH